MTELNPKALEAHNPFQGPVPGQSLTNSPDSQQPWEQAPKITSVKEGRETMFLEILKEENLEQIVELLDEGMSIAKLTEMLLFIGFTKGQFNPDMMLMLAEPVMYMLLAITEQVGIEPIINEGEAEEDEADETTAEDNQDVEDFLTSKEEGLRNPKRLEDLEKNISANAIPKAIKDRVEQIDFEGIKESLLAKPTKSLEPEEAPVQEEEVQAQVPQQNASLLQRTE